jgi:hypothetical protein
MSDDRIEVVSNSIPVTVVVNAGNYIFTVTADEYTYTITDTEFYRPSYDFSNARNSMYIETLPIF